MPGSDRPSRGQNCAEDSKDSPKRNLRVCRCRGDPERFRSSAKGRAREPMRAGYQSITLARLPRFTLVAHRAGRNLVLFCSGTPHSTSWLCLRAVCYPTDCAVKVDEEKPDGNDVCSGPLRMRRLVRCLPLAASARLRIGCGAESARDDCLAQN